MSEAERKIEEARQAYHEGRMSAQELLTLTIKVSRQQSGRDKLLERADKYLSRTRSHTEGNA